MTFCGRTTKRGTVCEASPLSYWQLPKREGRPQSCLVHLTDEERAEYNRETADAKAARAAAYEKADQAAPACWGWPVPENPAPRDPAETSGLSDDALESLREALKDPDIAGLAVIQEWQAGRCGICSSREELVTDHNHATGLVRGMLCRSCNTAEAFRTVGPFRRYRERPPAVILGVKARYWDPFTGEYAEPKPVAPPAPPEIIDLADIPRARKRRRRQLDDHPAYTLASGLAARLTQEEEK